MLKQKLSNKPDYLIGYNEAATHLFSMAQLNDYTKAITKSKNNNTCNTIQYNQNTIDEIRNFAELDEERAEKIE